MTTYYTVSWDNSDGTDWDKCFDHLATAHNYYQKLVAPFKALVMTDTEHGDRTILNSAGEDNISKLGVRHLIW